MYPWQEGAREHSGEEGDKQEGVGKVQGSIVRKWILRGVEGTREHIREEGDQQEGLERVQEEVRGAQE